MRNFNHHSIAVRCPGCVDRLLDADNALTEWFNEMKKARPLGEHPMHVSWAFRDEETQNAEVAKGASKLHWPHSKHNFMVDGVPRARALDIFQEDESGRAIFDPIFCAKVNAASIASGHTLRWGGSFHDLGDSGHFELS